MILVKAVDSATLRTDAREWVPEKFLRYWDDDVRDHGAARALRPELRGRVKLAYW